MQPVALVTSGTCTAYISSIAECEAAAESLGLSDVTCINDGQDGKSYDPPGCYLEYGSLKQNMKMTNTGRCSIADKCLCYAPPSPPPSPPAPPSAPTPPVALVTSGTCAAYISSINECEAAAEKLGLSDLTCSDDGQDGKSYDPQGCYFEGGSLKLNVRMSNTGRCSSADKCLCFVPPSPPPAPPRAPMQPVALVTSGTCAAYISSIADCEAAAESLQLSDVTCSDDRQDGKPYDPPGCCA